MKLPSATRGARPSQRVREPWLFLVGLGVQLAVVHGLFPGLSPGLTKLTLLVSYVPLLVGVARNLRWWGIRVIGVGLLLNFAATAANGGLMPVSPEAAERAGLGHLVAQVQPGSYVPGGKSLLQSVNATRLQWLSDLIPLGPVRKVVSPGDLVVVGGFLVFLLEVVRGKLPRPAAAPLLRKESPCAGGQ